MASSRSNSTKSKNKKIHSEREILKIKPSKKKEGVEEKVWGGWGYSKVEVLWNDFSVIYYQSYCFLARSRNFAFIPPPPPFFQNFAFLWMTDMSFQMVTSYSEKNMKMKEVYIYIEREGKINKLFIRYKQTSMLFDKSYLLRHCLPCTPPPGVLSHFHGGGRLALPGDDRDVSSDDNSDCDSKLY